MIDQNYDETFYQSLLIILSGFVAYCCIMWKKKAWWCASCTFERFLLFKSKYQFILSSIQKNLRGKKINKVVFKILLILYLKKQIKWLFLESGMSKTQFMYVIINVYFNLIYLNKIIFLKFKLKTVNYCDQNKENIVYIDKVCTNQLHTER